MFHRRFYFRIRHRHQSLPPRQLVFDMLIGCIKRAKKLVGAFIFSREASIGDLVQSVNSLTQRAMLIQLRRWLLRCRPPKISQRVARHGFYLPHSGSKLTSWLIPCCPCSLSSHSGYLAFISARYSPYSSQSMLLA